MSTATRAARGGTPKAGTKESGRAVRRASGPGAHGFLAAWPLTSLALALGLAAAPAAQATIYGPNPCNVAAGVGPDGEDKPAGATPVDGSGPWSNVIGCNADGGNYSGVQVMGAFAVARGDAAVALGFAAEATRRGTAVGMQARASGFGATALGQWSRAIGAGSVAIGGATEENNMNMGAIASGNLAIALGGQSRALGEEAVAIGLRATAVFNGDVAIGPDARAQGTNDMASVAIGRGAAAIGEDATALGNGASARVDYGTAVGNFATVTQRNALAAGNSSSAGGIGATALGNFSAASADNSLAIGGGGQLGSFQGAAASAVGAVAIGGNDQRGAAAAAADAIALGGEASVASGAVSGIALGRGAAVLDAAVYGIAQGDGAFARQANDIAIGRDAATSADSAGDNIALGHGVSTGALGQNIAMGSGATTATASSAEGGAVAIGRDQRAIGNGAVALGDPNTANGDGAVALGADNTAAGAADGNSAAEGAVAIGLGNQALGAAALALGRRSLANAAGAVALGDAAESAADHAVAIGTGANAANAGDIALGAGSRTQAAVATPGITLDGREYQFAGTAPASTLSLGDAGAERTITHVAAGRIGADSTDAVNGSQLHASNQAIQALSDGTVKYDLNPDASIDYGSVTFNPGGDAARLGNVAAGEVSETSTEAVNGSQLNATNQQIAQLGDTFEQVAGDTSQAFVDANGRGIRYVRTNEAGLAEADASAQAPGSTAVGYEATASADNALALGRQAQARHAGSVALGANAVADGASLGTVAYNPGNGALAGIAPVGEVSIGDADAERRLSHVAAGADDTDAVNVSQLKSLAADVGALGEGVVKYDLNPDGSIDYGSVTFNPGGDAARLGNVAAGELSETSTEAVNGSQLNATNQQVTRLGDTLEQVAGDTSQAFVDANGRGIRYVRTNEAGLAEADASAQAPGSTAVGYEATASADNALALGRQAQARHAGSVALGANAVADGSTLGTVAFDPGGGPIAGTAPVGEVSLGSSGAERRLTHVAAGATDTDAVNVSQLRAVDAKIQDLSDTDTGIKYFHARSEAQDSQALGAESVAIGPRAVAGGEDAVALGNGARAGGAGSISLGRDSVADGAQAASLGAYNQVSGEGAYALGNNNTIAAANVFVLGSGVSILDADLAGAVVLGRGSSASAAVATAQGTLDGVVYTYAGGAPAAGDVVSVGSLDAPRQVQHVAAGRVAADSLDAVNGSQLYATHQAIDALGVQVDNISNGGGGVKYFRAHGGPDAGLADAQANGLGSSAVGPEAVANGADSVAVGRGANAGRDGDVALGAGAVADRGAEQYTGPYSGAQNNTVGTVAIGAEGAERSLSHVADGRQATDAVNLRQLDGAVRQANDYTDQRITEVAGTVIEVDDRLNAIDNRVTGVEGDMAGLRQGSDGMFQVSQESAPPAAPRASGTRSTAGGEGAVASGRDSSAIGNGAAATGAGATALGQGSQASGNGSVALGAGSQATRDNTVAVGRSGAERQIAHVARGTAGTDAVNVDQLRELDTDLRNQVAGVRQDMSRLDDRFSAGVAASMAMSALPQAYLPGRSMLSVGGASWRGESGIAMGLSTVSDNGKWVVKGLASGTSRGDVGAAVGVGYQW